MFVVALAPFKSHCYFLFIYHVKNIGQVIFSKPWYHSITCRLNVGEILIHLIHDKLVVVRVVTSVSCIAKMLSPTSNYPTPLIETFS